MEELLAASAVLGGVSGRPSAWVRVEVRFLERRACCRGVGRKRATAIGPHDLALNSMGWGLVGLNPWSAVEFATAEGGSGWSFGETLWRSHRAASARR